MDYCALHTFGPTCRDTRITSGHDNATRRLLRGEQRGQLPIRFQTSTQRPNFVLILHIHDA